MTFRNVILTLLLSVHVSMAQKRRYLPSTASSSPNGIDSNGKVAKPGSNMMTEEGFMKALFNFGVTNQSDFPQEARFAQELQMGREEMDKLFETKTETNLAWDEYFTKLSPQKDIPGEESLNQVGVEGGEPISPAVTNDTYGNVFRKKFNSTRSISHFPLTGPPKEEKLYEWPNMHMCMISDFSSDYPWIKPFYVWSNDQWQASIQKLLTGEAVQFKADVDRTGGYFRQKSAMKFKIIELSLKARNASRQAELDGKLQSFMIEMVHSGVSLYQMKGKHWVHFDPHLRFEYSFEMDGNGRHLSLNGIKDFYDKLDDYEVLLSPYTWWTFRLTDLLSKDGLRELTEFEVSLELKGRGIYLDESWEESYVSRRFWWGLPQNLGDYYKAYDPEASEWQAFESEMDNKVMKW